MTIVALSLFVALFALASGKALGQNALESSSAARDWVISETKSPVDYSPVVIATTRSRDSAAGSALELSFSCRSGHTNVVVRGRTISGRGDDYAISYRINDEEPVQLGAGRSFGGGVSFQGDIVRLLRSFPDQGEITIRLASRAGSTREGYFSLNGLAAVRTKLAAACRWPQATAKPGNQ
jgi:hypothetical protein